MKLYGSSSAKIWICFHCNTLYSQREYIEAKCGYSSEISFIRMDRIPVEYKTKFKIAIKHMRELNRIRYLLYIAEMSYSKYGISIFPGLGLKWIRNKQRNLSQLSD